MPLSSGSVDWRTALPVLSSPCVTLREVEEGDASALHEQLTRESVYLYIDPPPLSVEGFEQFIRWTRMQRQHGRHLTYGAVAPGQTAPVGVLQLWRETPEATTAEWGLAIGEAYWGTGLAVAASRLMLDFAVATLGVHRLEALSSVDNDRGNGMLAKLGATREGTRRATQIGTRSSEDVVWSISAHDWMASSLAAWLATRADG